MGEGSARWRGRAWFFAVIWMWAAAGVSACYDSKELPPIVPPPECNDADGDGYGMGEGCPGSDCDDADATVWDSCGADCQANPRAQGCSCNAAFEEPEICYAGPAGTSGVGICRSGIRVCRDGSWGACEGQVLPSPESCDEVDNDCNGVVDQGVQGPCGTCDLECKADCAGVGCGAGFETNDGAESEADGSVVLSSEADRQPHEIWLADSQAATVTRVDTRTLEVLGTYRTGPSLGVDAPSAVAVDGEGSAFIVNSRQGQNPTTLTKIWASGCPDGNGDGRVETSTNDEPLRWGDDECVAWNVEVEDCGNWSCGYGWNVALTEQGRYAWVALYQGSSVVEVDAETGERTGREVTVSTPTGLVADADGYVWVSAYSSTIRRFSPDDPEHVDSFNLGGQSWITNLEVDDEGQIVVASPLGRFDPATEEGDLTGYTAYDVVIDFEGLVWVASGNSTVRRYDADLSVYDSFSIGNTPLQLAADRDGHVWSGQQWGGEPLVIVDATSGDDVGSELGGCGGSCVSTPVLEGDPAGLRYRRVFGGGTGEAVATHLYESDCPAGTTYWREISWQASGGEVEVSARAAEELGFLPQVPWVEIGTTPPDAGRVEAPQVGNRSFLEVSATLSGREVRLESISVQWSCLLDP